MAKRETVATLRRRLAATERKLKAATNPYARQSVLVNMLDECFHPIVKDRSACERTCTELSNSAHFLQMVECCDHDTVGFVITDAILVGMEMGKRLNEAQKLEEMVGYREAQR